MFDEEKRARIRRLFFAEHWTVGTICAELSVHRDAVLGAIGSDSFNRHAARPLRASIVDPYKDFIKDVLDQHPRLRATRIFGMVKDRGYPGSVVQLRRYVQTVRPQVGAQAYFRLRTLPGEQAQVDWGHFGHIQIGAARRPLSCFVMVLSSSRAMYAAFFLSQTLESFLLGHVQAFSALGGVPRQILYDNLKSAVLERHGALIRFHPQLLELCGHYHFAPVPCAPARGNEKGKVERTIQYLRHAFFAARLFASVLDLNEQLRRWIEQVAHQRKVPGDPQGTLVQQALVAERPLLLPLPAHPFPTDLVVPIQSGKTPYVRFDLNDYSIPHALVQVPLTLIASLEHIRLCDAQGQVVARHPRSYDRGQIVEDPAHLEALAQHKHQAQTLRGRDRLAAVCPSASTLLQALCARNEPLGPQTSRLLSLLTLYGAPAVEAAIKEALSRGTPSAASVAHLLEQARRKHGQPPPVPVHLPDDPRITDLRVAPHDLSAYDALARINKEDES